MVSDGSRPDTMNRPVVHRQIMLIRPSRTPLPLEDAVSKQGNCMWALYQCGMGFQPMNHRQDADATSVPNVHMQLPCVSKPPA